MIGCALAALVIVKLGVLPEPQMQGVLDLARHHARAAALQNHLRRAGRFHDRRAGLDAAQRRRRGKLLTIPADDL